MLLRVTGCSRYTTQLLSQPHTALLSQISTHALRASRRQPVGALVHSVAGMRSNVLEPHRRAIGPQGRYRALLLRSTSALFLRDAHAPVVVQIVCDDRCEVKPRDLLY